MRIERSAYSANEHLARGARSLAALRIAERMHAERSPRAAVATAPAAGRQPLRLASRAWRMYVATLAAALAACGLLGNVPTP